jgi:hypothetical protein
MVKMREKIKRAYKNAPSNLKYVAKQAPAQFRKLKPVTGQAYVDAQNAKVGKTSQELLKELVQTIKNR